ncbi:MAG TPA: homogentisate 1,2-dioxygenase, partial [Candidatus Kapabacteria bacterium]|nr:homogentisate 1,2-dioxygenase [Candidatus Kapabacteria bacterium]
RTTRQAHVSIPEGTYEEEHGREGFFGRVSHLYHAHPPTGWTRIEGNLRPHAFDLNQVEPTDMKDPRGVPEAILYNQDVIVSISRRSEAAPYYSRNADGDELFFIHKGEGTIETDFGVIKYEPGDYIVIPRATTYRFNPYSDFNFIVVIESHSEILPPSPEQKGLIGMHALYDMSAIEIPEFTEYQKQDVNGKEYELRVKRLGEYTSLFYNTHPIDIVGWKGDLTVFKINMRDIRPVMSHRVHLPPSAHTTFLADNFVICSFLPRPLEEGDETLKIPFYHRNTDYDEVLFYHDGDFFSRDNIKPAMMTLHPQGIHHGPHPKATLNQNKNTRTNEYAVMLDARNPLNIAPAAEAVEWKEYWASWQEHKAEKV